MARILVKSLQPGVAPVVVEVDNVSDGDVSSIHQRLDQLVAKAKARQMQVSDAVAEGFLYAINRCPTANPSDLWQHLIYRRVVFDLGYNEQQWKRISGYALERVFRQVYNPRLEKYQVRFRHLTGQEMMQLLAKLGLNGTIKPDKIDLVIEAFRSGVWYCIGGVHCKASIAERIQDDVPASRALMEKGLLSIALTMDSKSYPPPHGDGINWGELGARTVDKTKDRPKRAYIEEDGQFDCLFSFNLRTPRSPENTPSGKRILVLGLNDEQPDDLVSFLDEWNRAHPDVGVPTQLA